MTEPAEKLEDAAEDEADYGDGDDGGEYILLDGEAYFYGGKAEFCEQFGVVALLKEDGAVMVGVSGQGLVSLHEFLKKQGKPSLAVAK